MTRKALLGAVFLGWCALASAEKKDYQVSQSNDDAEENAGNGNMSLNSSDLELIADGGTDQLVGIRFQSIEIPQGATIVSAVIEFETDETNTGATSVTIQGEDIDDAPTFTGTNSNISNRTLTTASVAWNSIPSWSTVSERHVTPDLTSIVQEIVDRGGWSPGNNMVFVITGSGERTAESHNGESQNAPILRIEFEGLNPAPGSSLCYGAADSGDRFVIIDITDATVDTNVGPLGATSVEALAIDPTGLDVYGADADQLGRIDTETGAFLRLIEPFGTGGGSAGSVPFDDVDSLAFDHDTGTLWGVQARGGADALFQIDPDTGAHIPNVFSSGTADYILITGTGIGTSIDEIAIDPTTGTMYASDTSNSQLITINTSTGAGTIVGGFGGTPDMEGLGFHSDGTLYGSEGQRVYTVNTSTGAATQIGSGDTLTVGDDYEGFDCHFTALTRAVIARFDATTDGGGTVVEWETTSEDGTAGFYLYRYDYAADDWLLVHDGMLPGLLSSPQGGEYRLVDPTAGPDAPLLYALVEVEVGGRVRTLGLYAPQRGDSPEAPPVSKRFERRARRTAAHTARRTLKRELHTLRQSNDLKLRASRPGIYHVEADRVAEALGRPELSFQIASAMTSGRVSLSRLGAEVDWLPAPDSSGLYFYAVGSESIYGVDDIYRLRFRPGRTMQRVALHGGDPVGDVFVDDIDFEEDLFPATVVALDPESDYWFWEFISAGSEEFETRVFAVNVPKVAAGGATLEVRLFGATSTGLASEHHARVRFNGVDVGSSQWSGIGAHTFTASVPEGLVNDGANAIEIQGILDAAPHSIFYVDGFSLQYSRLYEAVDDELRFQAGGRVAVSLSGFTDEPYLFDITRPHLPRYVTAPSTGGFVPPRGEHRYFAVGPTGLQQATLEPWVESTPTLSSRANRADYLVIAPDELVTAAETLTDYRSAQGLSTMIVGLSAIENEFQDGFRGPEAIRRFLSRTRRWQGAPRYVVLLGEGSLDYKNLLGHDDSLIPPVLRRGIQGVFASDNSLGAPGEDLSLPAMAIGRLPIANEEELEIYVEKLRDFENGARLDELLTLSDAPDTGGEFAADSAQMTASLEEFVDVRPLSLESLPIDLAREQLFAQLREGTGIMTYAGHGGLDRLSSSGLLTSADVPSLDDSPYASILISLSCSTNRFDVPGFDSLGEVLVRQERGGAVAVWAPAGLTAHGQSKGLAQLFLQQTFQGGHERLGDAVVAALRDYALFPDSERLLRTFNLLGDPALKLPR